MARHSEGRVNVYLTSCDSMKIPPTCTNKSSKVLSCTPIVLITVWGSKAEVFVFLILQFFFYLLGGALHIVKPDIGSRIIKIYKTIRPV